MTSEQEVYLNALIGQGATKGITVEKLLEILLNVSDLVIHLFHPLRCDREVVFVDLFLSSINH